MTVSDTGLLPCQVAVFWNKARRVVHTKVALAVEQRKKAVRASDELGPLGHVCSWKLFACCASKVPNTASGLPTYPALIHMVVCDGECGCLHSDAGDGQAS